MKILNWNIQRSGFNNNLKYALEQFNPDILCLQESFHPLTYLEKEEFSKITDHYIWEPTENGWGNMIFSPKYKITPVKIESRFRGRLIGGIVNIENVKVTIINLHVPITKNYSRYNLKEMFELSESIIKDANAIVTGDFNFGACFDKPGKTELKEYLDNILDKCNLIDTFPICNKIEIRSFRPKQNQVRINRIDYILSSKSMATDSITSEIVENEDIITRSDHNPVIVNLKI